MIYLAGKALHLVAMALWMGGMIVVPLAAAGAASDDIRRLRRVYATVATPAMIAVWLLGLSIATASGALQEGWLLAKLALVFVLSGLHGAIAGRLRRAAQRGGADPALARLPVAAAALLTAVAFLAVFRPF